jgi:uroporphyrinogen-III decarboxylase
MEYCDIERFLEKIEEYRRRDIMSDMEKVHEQRVQDIIMTCNHKEPKRVPVMGKMTAWAVANAGVKTRDLINNRELLVEKWTSFLKDIYVDCMFGFGIGIPMKTVWALESKTFFISNDEVTIQHKENTPMLVEEYPELIKDPISFMMNKICPRKFPALNKQYPENLAALKKAALGLDDLAGDTAAIIKRVEEEYGVARIVGSKLYAPLDLIFDRLRGFKGLAVDMRRNPQWLIEACEALFPIYMKLAENGIKGQYPFAVTTVHCPTFLGPKNFANFFWPTYKRMLLRVKELGTQTFIFMEGSWKPYYDFLNELPPNCIIGNLDVDDPIEAKKLIGDKITIVGGVPVNLLRYGTKQQCLDHAKKVIDVCAPGGGFIFTTDKALLSAGDVNIENLIAVNEFVHEYGVY